MFPAGEAVALLHPADQPVGRRGGRAAVPGASRAAGGAARPVGPPPVWGRVRLRSGRVSGRRAPERQGSVQRFDRATGQRTDRRG